MGWLGAGFIALQVIVARLLCEDSTSALRDKKFCSLSVQHLGVRYVCYSEYQLFLYTDLI